MLKYLIPFVLVMLYIAFFGRKIDPELSFERGWIYKIDPSSLPMELEGDNAEIEPFKFNGFFGYFNSSGVLYGDTVLYDTALDRDGFINFSSVNNELILRLTDGSMEAAIPFTGYPFFTGDRRFIISVDDSSLSEINTEGRILWQKMMGSIITDVSASSRNVFIGTLNEGALLLDHNGNKIFTYKPVSSRINVIYGTSVSRSGDDIMVVSGLDPQTASIFIKNREGYKKRYSFVCKKVIRRHIVSGFSKSGEYAFLEGSGKVTLIDVLRKKRTSFPLIGRIKGSGFDEKKGLFYILSSNDRTNYLSLWRFSGTLVFTAEFPGRNPFFKRMDSSIYLGIKDSLMKISLVRK